MTTRVDLVTRIGSLIMTAFAAVMVSAGWVFVGLPEGGSEVVACVATHLTLLFAVAFAAWAWVYGSGGAS